MLVMQTLMRYLFSISFFVVVAIAENKGYFRSILISTENSLAMLLRKVAGFGQCRQAGVRNCNPTILRTLASFRGLRDPAAAIKKVEQ